MTLVLPVPILIVIFVVFVYSNCFCWAVFQETGFGLVSHCIQTSQVSVVNGDIESPDIVTKPFYPSLSCIGSHSTGFWRWSLRCPAAHGIACPVLCHTRSLRAECPDQYSKTWFTVL